MRLSTKICLFMIFGFTQCLYAQSISQPSNTQKGFKLEIVTDILITELLAMKPPKYVITKYQGFFDVREFGYEWYPNDGKMKVAFLISAGLGDLAEIPLAVKLWVPLDSQLEYDEIRSKERQSESKLSIAVFCFSGLNKKQASCIEAVINESTEVYFDEHLIGKLE